MWNFTIEKTLTSTTSQSQLITIEMNQNSREKQKAHITHNVAFATF